jgi:RNA polymerase sigma-70 factor (ECF subfamily)
MKDSMKTLTALTDEELAVRYMDGDNEAFELLLKHNQSKLFTYIFFMVHDEEKANDFFQDTFIKIITKLQDGMYSPSGKFLAWCMRIAHNVIMDEYRNERSSKIVEPTEDNDLSNLKVDSVQETNREIEIINSQVLKDVKKMMNNLPASQREVVYMRFFQQMSFKEIAATTNVSINTSLGRMRYAVLNMRKMAREHGIHLDLY